MQVTNVGCGLTGLQIGHLDFFWDGAEGINYDLAFDGLDRVNDNSDCTWVELLL